jgi:hypothetical protein
MPVIMLTTAKRVKCVMTCLALCAGMAPFVHAQDIHKCVQGRSVAYQNAPCSDGQIEMAVLAIVPKSAAGTDGAAMDRRDASSDATRRLGSDMDTVAAMHDGPVRSPRWLPFARNNVAPGMTDDEVLNAPGAGMPTRIVRSGDARAWREVWFYRYRDGTARELSFTNGKLTGIETGEPATAAMGWTVSRG